MTPGENLAGLATSGAMVVAESAEAMAEALGAALMLCQGKLIFAAMGETVGAEERAAIQAQVRAAQAACKALADALGTFGMQTDAAFGYVFGDRAQ